MQSISLRCAAAKNAGVLKVANLDPIVPEQITSPLKRATKRFYWTTNSFIDVDGYYSSYKHFIGQIEAVVPKTGNVNNPRSDRAESDAG